jgi:hypothetical protein
VDSKIKEALEEARIVISTCDDVERDISGNDPEYRAVYNSAIDKIDEALSRLTDDPEPYNDALDYELLRLAYEEWNKQGTTEEGEAFAIKVGGYDFAIGFYGGAAYASRLAQEARSDERRRCAIIAMIYADNHGQEIVEGNLRGLYTAVLQGTGPANNHDHNAIVQALQNMIEYAETAIAHEKESNGHPRNKRYHDEMDADLKEAKTVLKELENNG